MKDSDLLSEMDGYVQLKKERDELRELITFWIFEGHLQTFEDRERFRKEARELLEKYK